MSLSRNDLLAEVGPAKVGSELEVDVRGIRDLTVAEIDLVVGGGTTTFTTFTTITTATSITSPACVGTTGTTTTSTTTTTSDWCPWS